MDGFTPELEKLIRELHDAICQLHDAIIGIDGQGGILRRLEVLEKADRIDRLERNYAKLNRNFWSLVALLVGLGIISGGLWGLLR
jgi:hypothetical protein